MAEGPAYVILGRGRWAQRMRPIISGEARSVALIEETRQRASEREADYVERLAAAMKASGAQIAWLCVAPGRHVSLMIQSAIEAGLHVIVEKPWYGSSDETQRLQSLARVKGRVIAVHFEYLVLDEVEKWRAEFHPGAGCRLGGRFFSSRSDRSGIPAIDNLGCHLLAIRECAVPSAEVSEIRCGYDLPDERLVWLDRGDQRLATIDLFSHGQPIIQRFMQKVEAALDSAAFPFDLEFALRVAGELNAFKSRGPA
jgi:Oxidoreductase family, NAD-binding Rossmann fold